jgi:hypothetical protein
MTHATLNLGKKITLIVGSSVYNENMCNFQDIISKFNTIELSGLSKPGKKAKYENMLLSTGFNVGTIIYCNNAGFEGNNSDVINFRIEFNK